ncbi:transposase, partial [Methyloglobulus sp.]|uniref:transposase n=1 Tax=Methyloglobulus sp. TaxID=2518622 RepID=UPI0039898DAE
LDCLKWLRWPNGFFCPQCGTSSQWRMEGGRFWCAPCQRRSCDCRNHLSPYALPSHGLVCSRLAYGLRKEWRPCKNPA